MTFSGNQDMELNDPSGLVWVNHSGTDAVPDAVYAGRDASGQEMYVARAMVRGYLSVGKYVPGSGEAFRLNYGTPPAPFQVLTNPKQVQFKWALAEPGKYPPTAVLARIYNKNILGGVNCNLGKCYIGRSKHQGNTAVGFVFSSGLPTSSVVGQAKVIGENQLCYSINGSVHITEDFEILLAKAPNCCQCPPTFTLNCSKSYPKKMK